MNQRIHVRILVALVLVALVIPEGQGESYIIGLDFLACVNNITVS